MVFKTEKTKSFWLIMVDFRGGESLWGNQSEFSKIVFALNFVAIVTFLWENLWFQGMQLQPTELQMMRENVGREQ